MHKVTVFVQQLEQERARLALQLERIDTALRALRGTGIRKRRKLSAAAIAGISAGQRARWAKWRKKHGKK